MKHLVTAVLDYSRIGKREDKKFVDLNEVLKEVLEEMNALIAAAGAEINAGDLPTIKGYRVELKELFQNLLSNTVKFRKKDTSPVIHLGVEHESGFWKFTVSDNGIGLEEKFYERIFVIFQRLHNRSEYEGTGIGLSLCKKIVEVHGGKIWVQSQPGRGSTFYFTLERS